MSSCAKPKSRMQRNSSLPVIKAVIVGGGKGCRDLLLLLEEYQPRHARLEILGVADINPEAPGLKLAAKKGLYITNDFVELIKRFPDLNLIIELTGKDEVLEKLWKIRPKKVNILDHQTAWVFWEIVTLLREREACELRLQQMEMKQLYMDLISHFAHELRNPLMVIGGLARILCQKDDLDPQDIRKYATTIAEEAKRLEKFMYHLSKIVEPLKPRFKLISLNNLVFSVVQKFRNRFPDIDIKVVLDNEIPDILADPDLLEKALWELLKNAAEVLEESSEKIILVETRLCYDTCAIVVKDSGPGMDEEQLRLATLPFYTQKPGHLGLGLYLVSKVASAHNGNFYLLRDKDGGTVAIIELPLRMLEKPPLL